MLVNLNFSDPAVYASTENTDAFEIKGVKSNTMSFNAPIGFNHSMAHPTLALMALLNAHSQRETVIKTFKAADKDYTWHGVSVAKGIKTSFLFAPYVNLGINVTTLTIMVSRTGSTVRLMVPSRFSTYLSKCTPDTARQLTALLYAQFNLLYSVNAKDMYTLFAPVETGALFNVKRKEYDALQADFNSKCSGELALDVSALNDDTELHGFQFCMCTAGKESFGTTLPGKFVYNSVHDNDNGLNMLLLTNVAFTPNEHFVLAEDSTAIYTDTVFALGIARGFEGAAVQLVANAIPIEKQPKSYSIHVRSMSEFFAKHKNVTIGTDASAFDSVFDAFPNIIENYDKKIYEGLFGDAKVSYEESGCACKDYADDAYAQELLKQNQPFYEKVELDDLTTLVKGIAKGDVYSALFQGPAGTSKSTIARVLCQRAGIPWESVNVSLNADEADLFGSFIPNPAKKNADDPEFVWKDGVITRCLRNGYALIVEEINGARPGVLMKLNGILDDARKVELGNGETVYAHPNFRLIATCNVGYEGTNRLNQALIDRFTIGKAFVDPDDSRLLEIVKLRTGYSDATKIDKGIAAYDAIKKYSNEQRLGLTLSVRRLIAMFTAGKYFKTAKDAFIRTVVDPVFLEHDDHRKYFMDTVLPAYDLKFKI